MKQKSALPAAALRSSDPGDRPFPRGKGKVSRDHHTTTSAPIAERPDWRNECRHHRGTSAGSKKFSHPAKKGTSLSWLSKTLSPGQSRIRLGKTRLPDPASPGAHGHDESRGPINDLCGGYRSRTLRGNHACGSPHRLNSSYCWGPRGRGSLLILQGLFVSARGPSGDSSISLLTGMPHPPAG